MFEILKESKVTKIIFLVIFVICFAAVVGTAVFVVKSYNEFSRVKASKPAVTCVIKGSKN